MAGIIGPIVVIDPQGRRIEAQADTSSDIVFVGIGPVGCFVFDRTNERDPITGAVIYQQRLGPNPKPLPQPIDVPKVVL